jgi:hypothetical protein
VLCVDQTDIVVEAPPQVSRHEILKRAIKRYKNKSVALDQNLTPSFNKIYEMPK